MKDEKGIIALAIMAGLMVLSALLLYCYEVQYLATDAFMGRSGW